MLCAAVFLLTAATTAFAAPKIQSISLSNARTDVLGDGSVVISMEADGDIRGLITLALTRGADPSQVTSGTWTLMANYVEYLTDAGVVVRKTDPPPADGSEIGPKMRVVRLGSLSGTVTGGSLTVGDGGALTDIGSLSLTVDSGTVTFTGATGDGSATASSINDIHASSGSLTLSF